MVFGIASRRGRALAFSVLCGVIGAASAAVAATAPVSWSSAGADLSDSHAVLTPTGASQLSPATVRNLSVKWTFTTNGSISATPTVEAGGLYVPDWAGYLYKIDPDTGALIWSTQISTYTGQATYSRTSPAISGNTIVIGDIKHATIIAINKMTGALLWSTRLNKFTYGSILGSPVISNGVVYASVASSEEGQSNPAYTYVAQGSVAALDLATGAVKWQFTTVPAGYSGGGVWGSTPVVSTVFGSLFVGTGNNTTIPDAANACVAAAGSDKTAQLACLDPSDYVDAILALDLTTGHLKWSRRVQGADTWRRTCLSTPPTGCPNPAGLDADFGAGPNLVRISSFTGVPDDRGGTSTGYLLGAGQKGGMYWGLNPANGGLFWSTSVSSGDLLWGAAAGSFGGGASNYIFTGVNNPLGLTNTLLGQVGKTPVTSWTGGYWNAINAVTGALVWQVPTTSTDLAKPGTPASAPGPVSYTNGLVFAGDNGGTLVALDAVTGYRFWSFNTGVTVRSGPAIYNDTLYWGVGYPLGGVPGNTLYAFAVPH